MPSSLQGIRQAARNYIAQLFGVQEWTPDVPLPSAERGVTGLMAATTDLTLDPIGLGVPSPGALVNFRARATIPIQVVFRYPGYLKHDELEFEVFDSLILTAAMFFQADFPQQQPNLFSAQLRGRISEAQAENRDWLIIFNLGLSVVFMPHDLNDTIGYPYVHPNSFFANG